MSPVSSAMAAAAAASSPPGALRRPGGGSHAGGGRREPACFPMAARRRPPWWHCHGSPLVTLASSLSLAGRILTMTGRDVNGDELIPGSIAADPDGLLVVPYARHPLGPLLK